VCSFSGLSGATEGQWVFALVKVIYVMVFLKNCPEDYNNFWPQRFNCSVKAEPRGVFAASAFNG
jgi:hypothetical protein